MKKNILSLFILLFASNVVQAKTISYDCSVEFLKLEAFPDSILTDYCLYLSRKAFSEQITKELQSGIVTFGGENIDLREKRSSHLSRLVFPFITQKAVSKTKVSSTYELGNIAFFILKVEKSTIGDNDIASIEMEYTKNIEEIKSLSQELRLIKKNKDASIGTEDEGVFQREEGIKMRQAEDLFAICDAYEKICRGILSYYENNKMEALETFKEIMKRPFAIGYAQRYTGFIKFEMGDFEGSIPHFKKSSVIKNDHLLFHKLGIAYFENEQYQEAFESFSTSKQINPTFIDSYIYVGDLQILQRGFPEATQEFLHVLTIEPDNYKALRGLGEVHFNQANIKKSKELLIKSYNVNKTYYKTTELIGDIFYKEDNIPKAKKYYTIALEHADYKRGIQAKLAACCNNYLPFEEDEEEFSEFSEDGYQAETDFVFEDSNTDAINFESSSEIASSFLPDDHFLSHFGIYPDNTFDEEGSTESLERGVQLLEKKKVDNAMPYFKDAIEKFYQNCMAYYYLGYSLYKKREWEDATKALEQSLKMECEYSYAPQKYSSVHKLRARKGRQERDEGIYDFNTHVMLGQAYLYIDDLSLSSSNFLQAAEKHTNSPTTNYLAGKSASDIAALTSDSNKLNFSLRYLKKAERLGHIEASILLDRLGVKR